MNGLLPLPGSSDAGGGRSTFRALRVNRMDACPMTVRVVWAAEGSLAPEEVIFGARRPDCAVCAWGDTTIGDLLTRALAQAPPADIDLAAFFSVAVHFVGLGLNGALSKQSVTNLRFQSQHNILASFKGHDLKHLTLTALGYLPGLVVHLIPVQTPAGQTAEATES